MAGNSILTDTQREFLRMSEEGRKAEYTKQQRHYHRNSIRTRVYRALLDGPSLWHLPIDERKDIFTAWQDSDAEIDQLTDSDESEWALEFNHEVEREREKFNRGLVSLIAFLYHGISMSDTRPSSEVFEDAIEHAERVRRGEHVDAEITISHRYNTEQLMRRFQTRDPTLTTAEINHLQQETALTPAERAQYYNDAFEDSDDESSE